MEKVDIIIPVYNAEDYIVSAIESIKKQTNPNWNLIIINDASEDNSLAIINDAVKDIQDKVHIIDLKQNLGVSNARNLGIIKSTNRYIAFLDADDIWKEDKLEKQINFMKNNNYSFTYTNYIYWKNDKYKKVKKFISKLSYKQALKDTFILTSTVMIDTQKIKKEHFVMPNIQSEDTATWWNILKQGNIAYGINEHLTIYRITKNSLSANKFCNLKRTWNLYRKVEMLGRLKSTYYFTNYVCNAIMKRII